ncbi:MAG: S-methyl-5'-thioadenosine phosphorylase [Candidatus Nealsonbacteria bacterium]|nr:S-methyl-5'-thioadenosine phosphorylase [Candidatus Nealsonbacteria bacterium]
MPENFSKFNPKIAIIGGSGLEDPRFFKKIKEVKIKTPFGYPSSPISVGDFFGSKIGFLSRHGKNHGIPPHKVNSRANLWALKKLGVERIIGVSAVGSLQKSFKPGDIAICDQFIDFTKKRDYTFYDQETVHVSLADPFCPELRDLFCKEAKKLKIPVHKQGTYWCIEGPRFSTRAESKFFRNFADIIGMTLVPEVSLARELGICYLTLTMVTDYDVWQAHPVSLEQVLKTMGSNAEKIKKLLGAAIPKIKSKKICSCEESLKDAKI